MAAAKRLSFVDQVRQRMGLAPEQAPPVRRERRRRYKPADPRFATLLSRLGRDGASQLLVLYLQSLPPPSD